MTDRVTGYDTGYRGFIEQYPENRSLEYLVGYAKGIRDKANDSVMRATHVEPSHKEVVIEKTTGRKVINIDPGTLTLVLDLNRMSQAAIGDFIKEIVKQWPERKFSQSDIVGLAIGKFDVPLSEIFDGTVDELSSLDDTTLAHIFRFREAKRKEE